MARPKQSTEYEKHSSVKFFKTVFSERLSELVKQKKDAIGKEKLCADLGVSKRTIELWEARQSRPDIDKLAGLADYFGVTVDYLVGRATTPAPTLEDAYITEQLGISKEAIKVLRCYRKDKEAYGSPSNLDVLNDLIQSEKFLIVLAQACAYRESREKCRETEEDISSNFHYIEKYEKQPLALWTIQKALIEVVEETAETREFEKIIISDDGNICI